jgi:TENA/THI-4/PQQC family
MSFFERLKTAASAEWRAYTEHPFTNGLADGSLAEAAFRHYLVQDYLFLIEFARAYDQAMPTTTDILQATDYVVTAIEIVGSRIANWDIRIVDTLADNASSGLFVVGHQIKRLAEIDVIDCGMSLDRGGRLVSTGTKPTG